MKLWVAQPERAGTLTRVYCMPGGVTKVSQHFRAQELITLETTDEVEAVVFGVWFPCDRVKGNVALWQLPAKLVVS